MDLIKCPICREEYHPSYKRCPFCEEAGAAKHRVRDIQKERSARGGIVLVLTLVLALLGWYLFGGKAPEGEVAPPTPAAETVNSGNAPGTSGGEQTAPPQEGGEQTPPAEPTEPAEAAPPAESAPTAPQHVDASALTLKTNVSGTLPKDPMTGFYDCSLKKSDKYAIRLIVTGTDVAVSGWWSENTNIVTVDAQGNLNPVGSGITHVAAAVGDATVTCIIRVR